MIQCVYESPGQASLAATLGKPHHQKLCLPKGQKGTSSGTSERKASRNGGKQPKVTGLPTYPKPMMMVRGLTLEYL